MVFVSLLFLIICSSLIQPCKAVPKSASFEPQIEFPGEWITRDFAVYGDYIYVLAREESSNAIGQTDVKNARVEIFNASDPQNPTSMSNISVNWENEPDVVAVCDSCGGGPYLFIEETSGHSRMEIYDVNTPTTPVLVNSSGPKASQPRIYTGFHYGIRDDNIVITNVSNALEPSTTDHNILINTTSINGQNGFDFSGTWLYVASSSEGLVIIDISKPLESARNVTLSLGQDVYAIDVMVWDSTAFVATSAGVFEVDIATPLSPGTPKLVPNTDVEDFQWATINRTNPIEGSSYVALKSYSGSKVFLFEVPSANHSDWTLKVDTRYNAPSINKVWTTTNLLYLRLTDEIWILTPQEFIQEFTDSGGSDLPWYQQPYFYGPLIGTSIFVVIIVLVVRRRKQSGTPEERLEKERLRAEVKKEKLKLKQEKLRLKEEARLEQQKQEEEATRLREHRKAEIRAKIDEGSQRANAKEFGKSHEVLSEAQQEAHQEKFKDLADLAQSRMDAIQNHVEEMRRLEKFADVIRVSRRIPIKRVAELIEMGEKEIWEKAIEWGKQFGFKIDGEDLLIESEQNVDAFIKSLEKDFESWGHDGKV